MYASTSAQENIKPYNHFFNPSKSLQDKLGLAGSSYGAVQALTSVVSYLDGAFPAIKEHEEKLQKILLDFLNSRTDVTIHGSTSSDSDVRVPTVSFTIEGINPRDIVEKAEEISNLAFRWGHFYSKRLVDDILGLGPEGVTRVSMVHYNTEEEIQSLVEVLQKILP